MTTLTLALAFLLAAGVPPVQKSDLADVSPIACDSSGVAVGYLATYQAGKTVIFTIGVIDLTAKDLSAAMLPALVRVQGQQVTLTLPGTPPEDLTLNELSLRYPGGPCTLLTLHTPLTPTVIFDRGGIQHQP